MLHNGSQVTTRPSRKTTDSTPGYFTESGDDGAPSYPGQDWYNDCIDEFLSVLNSGNILFEPDRTDHLSRALIAIVHSHTQFAPYNAARIYHTGDVCYTVTDQRVSFWQWYSNVEWLAGKDPLDETNRRLQWQASDKPFYWIPYTGNQIGMPFFWLATTAPEWAVMEINTDLPVAVYWRLAERYPHLVKTVDEVNYINTGEIRGEFLRVLDQGRGVDAGREIGSWSDYTTAPPQSQNQSRLSESGTNVAKEDKATGIDITGFARVAQEGNSVTTTLVDATSRELDLYDVMSGDSETAPRNIARPMAITI
jgi:hypothetical protein